MNPIDDFRALLEDAIDETGASLSTSSDELAAYMSERSMHLSTITAEPGFAQAVKREATNVAMRAGLEASENAAAVDQRLFGMIAGALRIMAIALV